MQLSVAIVGSGPSGFYAAEAVLSALPDCQIDMIERLPTPFGLVRFGVAPDHQTVKRVTAGYEKTARSSRVHYFGNVALGEALSLEELRSLYDVVVLAVGAPRDRELGIHGEDKRGVLGSAAFVGWYNGHPDFAALDPPVDVERAVVVGNGNVALDVARILSLSEQEMAATDIAEEAKQAILGSRLQEIVVLGRRGAAQARFTNPELRAFAELENALPVVEGDDLAGVDLDGLNERSRRQAERNLETLRGFAAVSRPAGAKKIRFRFFARPLAISGGASIEAVRIAHCLLQGGRLVDSGEEEDISCGLLVKAIGYSALRIPGVPYDTARGCMKNREGRIAPGLYAVGWAKRGPRGVIGTNKADGKELAEQVVADIRPSGKAGRAGLEKLLAARGARWVSYDDWRRIDAAEVAAAEGGQPRKKFVSVADMLALLDPDQGHTT